MTADFDTAAGLYRAGRPAEAALACQEALAASPGDRDLLNLLGVSLHAAGNAAAAAEVLGRAVRVHPDHGPLLLNLVVVLQGVGALGRAAAYLRRFLAMEPEAEPALSRLGTVLQELGDLDGSLRVLSRAARLAPLSPAARFNLAQALTAAGDTGGAAAEARRLVLLSPDAAHAYMLRGEALLRLGRLDAASEAFRRAARLAPADAGALAGLARCRAYRLAASTVGGAADGLVVRGPFSQPSGYAHLGRRLIQTLRQRRVPLQVIGVVGGEVWEAEPLDRPVAARAMLNVLVPQVVERVPGLASVTFTMFEGTRIPEAWRRHSAASDLVVVPSRSSWTAWAAAGFPEDRLRLCPLGVDPEPAAVAPGPLPLAVAGGRPVSGFRHRFLNVSDFIARKNVDGLLRVWLRATSRADDAVLVLKLGKGESAAARAALADLVGRVQAQVGRRMEEAAPVLLVDQTLDEAGMTALFHAATHYVSLSHGEGWDLPMSKAGAMGLGLVAPRHSSYLDYLDESVAHMVPARVAPARPMAGEPPPKAFFGLDWWEPDEDAAAAILADIVVGRAGPQRSARDRLLSGFTWGQAADRLLAILREAGLLADGPAG